MAKRLVRRRARPPSQGAHRARGGGQEKRGDGVTPREPVRGTYLFPFFIFPPFFLAAFFFFGMATHLPSRHAETPSRELRTRAITVDLSRAPDRPARPPLATGDQKKSVVSIASKMIDCQ